MHIHDKGRIKVNFGGIEPISTVDWHGRSSCTIFLNMCQFRCPFCQNYKLLEKINIVDIDIIKNKIIESKDFISAVVFSGGEPTMQCIALENLAKFAKEQGLLVGIETNGYSTSVIKKLIEKDLLDKIFLDIKTSPLNTKKYSIITGVENADKKIRESLKMILDFHHDIVEVRTTIFRLIIDDILEIAKYLKENNYVSTYVLQQGIPYKAPKGEIRKERYVTIKEMTDIARNIHIETGIKTKIINWENVRIIDEKHC